MPGLTHGRSGSGKSFYFEPLEAVESNNRLQQSVEEEEAERRRILRELIDGAHAAQPAIAAQATFLANLDAQQAIAAFRQTTDARLAEVVPRRQLRLVAARHPLIDPTLAALRAEVLGTEGHTGDVVPLDLALDPDARQLVITGPNAGGKTVALKTVGLLALAHQCGLPIPAAAGSQIPFLQTVVATIGDEQDLLTDRSTFSGRLLRLDEAWRSAGPGALILLDELGSGTDPEEGAALSVALLEKLSERGGLGLITTHLTRVAAAALELEGASCAAMEFDTSSGRPTYRLLPGPPGGSEALALGRRLGLSSAWLGRAEALLGPEHRGLHRLLAEVEAARDAFAEQEAALAREHDDVARLRTRLAEQEAALIAERKTVGARARADLEAFRKETRDRLRQEIQRLQAQPKAVRAPRARQEAVAATVVRQLFEEAPTVVEEAPETVGAPQVGGEVRHRHLGWQGTLEKVARGKAQVRVRGKIFRCGVDDLDGIAATPAKPSPAAGRQPRPALRTEQQEAARELKLIGQRVEPALEALDRFLDQALLGGADQIRVVHGHGSGRLRRAVREALARHPAVTGHRRGDRSEGGDGATVVLLSDR